MSDKKYIILGLVIFVVIYFCCHRDVSLVVQPGQSRPGT
jgi:hypothetical protein